jgi:hypothetical protein
MFMFMSMLHVHVLTACPWPFCMSMTMLHFYIHASYLCPCCMPQYMLHLHVHAEIFRLGGNLQSSWKASIMQKEKVQAWAVRWGRGMPEMQRDDGWENSVGSWWIKELAFLSHVTSRCLYWTIPYIQHRNDGLSLLCILHRRGGGCSQAKFNECKIIPWLCTQPAGSHWSLSINRGDYHAANRSPVSYTWLTIMGLCCGFGLRSGQDPDPTS